MVASAILVIILIIFTWWVLRLPIEQQYALTDKIKNAAGNAVGGAMRNLDTPKAIIIAALIVSATIMFTFRYSFSEARGGLLFNHLTGTLMPCSNIYADCQITRFVESETPPPASGPPAQNQKPGLPEGFEPVNPEQFPGLPEGFEPATYSFYQPTSRPRRMRPTGP